MATSAPTPHGTDSPAEGRCGYYVEKKKRFCRMVVAAGKRFCGEHAGAAEVWYRLTLSRVGNKFPGPALSLSDRFLLLSPGVSSFSRDKRSPGLPRER